MELHPELEVLLRQAEAAFKKAVREHGRCAPFALVLRREGQIERLEPEAGHDAQLITGLILSVLPLARAGDIDASALCTTISIDDGHAAVIDLEHREAFRAVAVIPYGKRAILGWFFGAAQLKPDEPKLFATAPAEGVDIKHPHFHLQLDGDWTQVQSPDAEQFCFESRSRKSSIVISVMPLRVPRDKLLDAALALAEGRRLGELESNPTAKVTLGEMLVDLKENGQAGHVAYAGYDDQGRIFRFMGWVTQIKAFNLWVCTRTRNNDESKAVFGEVFDALRLAIP